MARQPDRQSWKISFKADAERQERDGEAGDRDCAVAERCAAATRKQGEDGITRRVPARCYQPVCKADREILVACLAAMPALHGRLGKAIGDRVVTGVLVRSPFGPSVPLRLDVDQVARLLVDSALSWLERVSDVVKGLYCPRTEQWRRGSNNGKAPDLLGKAAPVLAVRPDVLLSLPGEPMLRPSCAPSVRIAARMDAERAAGDEARIISVAGDTTLLAADGEIAALEFLELDYLARSALGETNPDVDQLLGVGCESCGKRSLRRALPPMRDGEPMYYSICDGCGHLMTDEEFRAWSARLVRFYAKRVTPAMLASAGLRGNESPAILATIT